MSSPPNGGNDLWDFVIEKDQGARTTLGGGLISAQDLKRDNRSLINAIYIVLRNADQLIIYNSIVDLSQVELFGSQLSRPHG